MVQYRPPVGSARWAPRLRKRPTDAERRMWRLLRECFPDAHFRRQAPIRSFIADFACHGAKLIIECDGGQHGTPADLQRTAMIEAEGYRVLRFWNHDILANRDGVATAVALALDERHPHPTLPHQGGGI